jgi:hypothetical protein
MRFGQRRSEDRKSLAEQLCVESIRLPRRLMGDVRRFAQANGLGISECYRRLLGQALAPPGHPTKPG